MAAVQLLVWSFLMSSCIGVDAAPKFPSVITIGAVVSSETEGELFQESINVINNDPLRPDDVTFNATYILMDYNPISAAKSVCSKLIPEQVYVVVVSHDADSQLGPVAISFTCGYYRIPVIGVSTRDSTFSDKNIHSTFMRTLAPFSHQTKVWGDLLRHFNFKMVIMIHSSDSEGRAILGYFQSVAEDRKIEIARTIQYTPGESDYTDLLKDIPEWKPRVLLLYANEIDASVIYDNADKLGLTAKGYAWFVTEQALKPKNTPIGVFGLKQIKTQEVVEQINDTVLVIAQAFRELYDKGKGLIGAPKECTDESEAWKDGDRVLRTLLHNNASPDSAKVQWIPSPQRADVAMIQSRITLKNQELVSGRTGRVAFDEAGDRKYVEYEIINVRPRGGHKVQDVVQKYVNRDNELSFVQQVWWPAKPVGTKDKPIGMKKDEHFRVVTIEAKPFTYILESKDGTCDRNSNHIKCPWTNSTSGEQIIYCCYGYAIDLLQHLAGLNFTYDLHLVEDGQYGSYEVRNGEKKKTWSGLIGEVLDGKSDMIVAPLTIDPDRADFVDFSKPFKYQGLTVLVKKTLKDSSLASFLQPFQDTLWILVGLSVHVVALVLYLLDRFSPFGRYKLAKSDDTEEDALNLSGAVWFAWGVLLNSGIGEGTPRSFSARVLGMVWAGFAMIIVASYTANLAAFLVLDRPEASISGIDDARLRNPQTSFNYNTVAGSSVSMYFKRQVELSTMFRTMQNHKKQYSRPEEAIEDIKQDKLQAFIWDSARLEYEAANDCDLVTAGELFGRSGYGIALAKDNPWTSEISMKILKLHERGNMEKLDSNWILAEDTKCPDKDPSAATLGLTNMAGVFMMVAGGIVMGVFLIFVEIAYKRHRGLKEKELELAKTAADRWRGNIEKRRTLRRTLLQQQMERSRLSNGESPAKVVAHPGTPPLRSRTGGYQQVATNVVTPRGTPSPCKVAAAVGSDNVV